MSVDDRLREAFGETDRTWDDRAAMSLAEVRATHRRETVVRRGAAAALVAAAAVTVVAVVSTHGSDDSPQPAPSPGPTPTSSATTISAGSPLDGTWRSGPVTRADVRAAARAAGDPGDAAAMLDGLPATPFRVVLVLDVAGNTTLLKARSGGQAHIMDEETIQVAADRVVLRPRYSFGGINTHTWVIKDGVLRFAFVSTTEGESDGVPGEAWQRLLYDTAAFTQ